MSKWEEAIKLVQNNNVADESEAVKFIKDNIDTFKDIDLPFDRGDIVAAPNGDVFIIAEDKNEWKKRANQTLDSCDVVTIANLGIKAYHFDFESYWKAISISPFDSEPFDIDEEIKNTSKFVKKYDEAHNAHLVFIKKYANLIKKYSTEEIDTILDALNSYALFIGAIYEATYGKETPRQ